MLPSLSAGGGGGGGGANSRSSATAAATSADRAASTARSWRSSPPPEPPRGLKTVSVSVFVLLLAATSAVVGACVRPSVNALWSPAPSAGPPRATLHQLVAAAAAAGPPSRRVSRAPSSVDISPAMHSSHGAVASSSSGGAGGGPASGSGPGGPGPPGAQGAGRKVDPARRAMGGGMAHSRTFFGGDPKEFQDLELINTQRQLNYRRRKDQIKKKLTRLKKLQKLRQEAEEKGENLDARFSSFLPFHPGSSGVVASSSSSSPPASRRSRLRAWSPSGASVGSGATAVAVDPSGEEADRISTASVMEERIRELYRDLAQLELEHPGFASAAAGEGYRGGGGDGYSLAGESYYGEAGR